jgi:hypothetical protein
MTEEQQWEEDLVKAISKVEELLAIKPEGATVVINLSYRQGAPSPIGINLDKIDAVKVTHNRVKNYSVGG